MINAMILPVLRNPICPPETVYVMPLGLAATDRTPDIGEEIGAAIYVHIDDPRTDDEIRQAVARWRRK